MLSSIVGLLVTVCFVQSLSTAFLFLYSTIALLICRKITHGHSYIPPSSKDITGQTIIVTGAASDIGRVTAVGFAKLGARVIVGIRGQSRA